MSTYNWFIITDTIDQKGWIVTTMANVCEVVGMPQAAVSVWFLNGVNYVEWNDYVIVKNPKHIKMKTTYRKKKK